MNPPSRSWNGCTRCRKRRQKCGEQRPQCVRCEKDGASCVYQKTWRFGGRPFDQSRFGVCISDGHAGKTATYDGGFVYTTPSVPTTATVESAPGIDETSNYTTVPLLVTVGPEDALSLYPIPRSAHRPPPTIPAPTPSATASATTTPLLVPASIPTTLDLLSRIPSKNKMLLQYFTCNASMALASHSFVHKEVCQLILPMALDHRALFYATLALAAIHRSSLSPESVGPADGALASQLTALSIRHLRQELVAVQPNALGPNLATVRTLFLCEAISGSLTLKAWRAHFLGARALMSSLGRSSDVMRVLANDPSLSFLHRWYKITEGLVAMTAGGLSAGQFNLLEPNGPAQPSADAPVCIDVYTGCAEDLSSTFREIGAVAWERRHAIGDDARPSLFEDDDPSRPRLTEEDFQREADLLEATVRGMIRRDTSSATLFNFSGAQNLTLDESQEFLQCNEAYQHTALIHIQRRIRRLPRDAPSVQSSVHRIIECVQNIRPAATLSPLTLLTTPLFTAGCEASGPDRVQVAQLLTHMFNLLRLPNMKRALEVLTIFWDESDYFELDWEEFSRYRKWDFLPY